MESMISPYHVLYQNLQLINFVLQFCPLYISQTSELWTQTTKLVLHVSFVLYIYISIRIGDPNNRAHAHKQTESEGETKPRR